MSNLRIFAYILFIFLSVFVGYVLLYLSFASVGLSGSHSFGFSMVISFYVLNRFI